MNNKQFIQSHRKHVCLISNHGYAGVKLPISEAPDTGGQNIFVHYLAHHLARLNYKITIFTRGGFPFYQSKKIRRGIEFLAPFIRYVYVPAGPSHFIYKEDLSPILDEEVEWIYYFIQKEAQIKHMKPYHYFQWINSHYWDGGIITNKLIKMFV